VSDYFKESDLAMLKNIQRLILAALILGLILSTGCTGKSDTQNTSNNGDGSNGRIIVPETDWTPANSDNNSGTLSDGSNTTPPGDTANSTSGSTVIRESGVTSGTGGTTDNGGTDSEITINIFINGEQTEPGRPIELYQGQPFEVLIQVSSTIYELIYYWVRTSDKNDTDIEGELTGYDAELKYNFIYNYSSWENGGISVMIRDALGNVTMQNVLLIPSQTVPNPR
jgi:hypothetical protein